MVLYLLVDLFWFKGWTFVESFNIGDPVQADSLPLSPCLPTNGVEWRLSFLCFAKLIQGIAWHSEHVNLAFMFFSYPCQNLAQLNVYQRIRGISLCQETGILSTSYACQKHILIWEISLKLIILTCSLDVIISETFSRFKSLFADFSSIIFRKFFYPSP